MNLSLFDRENISNRRIPGIEVCMKGFGSWVFMFHDLVKCNKQLKINLTFKSYCCNIYKTKIFVQKSYICNN